MVVDNTHEETPEEHAKHADECQQLWEEIESKEADERPSVERDGEELVSEEE